MDARCKGVCDTLRNDADDGDECVECGREFPDMRRAAKCSMPTPAVPQGSHPPTAALPPGRVPPHRRPGWFRNIQMHGVGRPR